ncbi:hypothetical protein pb186bvf_018014 [Paramecium bursaria]
MREMSLLKIPKQEQQQAKQYEMIKSSILGFLLLQNNINNGKFIKIIMYNNSQYVYQFKLIFLGDQNVGKAQIINQFSDQQLYIDIDTSFVFDLGRKCLQIDDTKIKLQIFHPAGQESFRSIVSSYYKNAAGAILVYDKNNRTSFNNLQRWINELTIQCHPQLTLLLVATNRALQSDRQVSFDEGKQFAKRFGIEFMEVSISDPKNIEQLFSAICQDILQKIKLGLMDINDQSLGILKIKQHKHREPRIDVYDIKLYLINSVYYRLHDRFNKKGLKFQLIQNLKNILGDRIILQFLKTAGLKIFQSIKQNTKLKQLFRQIDKQSSKRVLRSLVWSRSIKISLKKSETTLIIRTQFNDVEK